MRPLLLFIGLLALIGLITMAATFSPAPGNDRRADLRDYGPAPELTNTTWLNVDAPLRLADLRGRVVAIDMWTFG